MVTFLRRKKNASSHSKLKVALVHVVGCQLVSSSYQSEGGGGWGLIDCLLSSKFLVTAMEVQEDQILGKVEEVGLCQLDSGCEEEGLVSAIAGGDFSGEPLQE